MPFTPRESLSPQIALQPGEMRYKRELRSKAVRMVEMSRIFLVCPPQS
jgi:hypothetical protein